eukprot:CAMPEP_0170879518 /NCGR_PEP_ID=MMETSP0734-20130129/31781_1 /TAXON_ID=186038 /ORGANISM="Fragilariopsis kerguelensis, Strain L26-C5" /LENGTH=203 /DNA_ID=CAMNT_0011262653 /DNA_START=41 /DNA_END=648 /DNA_ORIENTATION=-
MNETPPSTTASPSSNTLTADVKISKDLLVLKEKMDLLDSMLHPVDIASPKLSVLTNDAIRVVIGYLDACAPRMVQLVEACTTSFGVVSEENLCDVFACNDRLQLLLSDVDTRMLTETPASTTSAKAATSIATTNVGDSRNTTAYNLTDQFGDLLLGNEDPFADAHGSGGVPSSVGTTATTTTVLAGAKTTGESSDDFKVPATS